MRVIAHPIKTPAAVIYQDGSAVLILRTGLVAASVITLLDRLLVHLPIS